MSLKLLERNRRKLGGSMQAEVLSFDMGKRTTNGEYKRVKLPTKQPKFTRDGELMWRDEHVGANAGWHYPMIDERNP